MVVAALLIGLAIASSVLVAASVRSTSLVQTLLVAYLAFVTNIVLIVLFLSPIREVTRAGLAVAEVILFASSLGVWWLRGRAPPPLAEARRALRQVVHDPVTATFLAVVILALAYELVPALTVPPNNGDSLTYHLSRVPAWAQHHGVHWIPNAPDVRLNEFQPVAEQEIPFFFVATGKGALFALPQYLAELATLVAVYGASRRIGYGVRAAACSAFLFATFALVALESTTSQNDLVAGSFPAAAACLILGSARFEPALAGFALAIGAGVKLTTILVWPVLAFLLWRRGWGALGRAVAGGAIGLVLDGMWGYVLSLDHTGHLLGHGPGDEWTGSASFRGDLETVLHVVYRTFDLGAFSYRQAYILAAVGVVAALVVGARAASRREALEATGVAIPFLAPLLVILAAAALAWLTEENGIFVHTGGWAGGLNNLVIEDSSAFGAVGAVVLLGVPLLTIGAYFARRVDVRHVALAPALPTFLILLALKASYNPWITRFLLVPAALTAPLFGILFRRRPVTVAFVVMAAIAVALTLGQNRRKPLESPFGPPWQLTWSESLKPQGGGALFGVLDDYDRLVPPKACVGAVLGPDEPSYLLYGQRLRHRVSYLPVEDPLLEAYRHSVFYVVISTGVNRKAGKVLTREGWKLDKLGKVWILATSPASGARTGEC